MILICFLGCGPKHHFSLLHVSPRTQHDANSEQREEAIRIAEKEWLGHNWPPLPCHIAPYWNHHPNLDPILIRSFTGQPGTPSLLPISSFGYGSYGATSSLNGDIDVVAGEWNECPATVHEFFHLVISATSKGQLAGDYHHQDPRWSAVNALAAEISEKIARQRGANNYCWTNNHCNH